MAAAAHVRSQTSKTYLMCFCVSMFRPVPRRHEQHHTTGEPGGCGTRGARRPLRRTDRSWSQEAGDSLREALTSASRRRSRVAICFAHLSTSCEFELVQHVLEEVLRREGLFASRRPRRHAPLEHWRRRHRFNGGLAASVLPCSPGTCKCGCPSGRPHPERPSCNQAVC